MLKGTCPGSFKRSAVQLLRGRGEALWHNSSEPSLAAPLIQACPDEWQVNTGEGGNWAASPSSSLGANVTFERLKFGLQRAPAAPPGPKFSNEHPCWAACNSLTLVLGDQMPLASFPCSDREIYTNKRQPGRSRCLNGEICTSSGDGYFPEQSVGNRHLSWPGGFLPRRQRGSEFISREVWVAFISLQSHLQFWSGTSHTVLTACARTWLFLVGVI